MSSEDRLAELLEQWEAAAAKGHHLSPEELCRDTPELVPEFSELLAQVAPVNAILKGERTTKSSPEELVGRMNTGRYTAVSFHAQGGLGVIFLADDQELHRPVALKRLQTLHAIDPAARRRFLIEAEITGKLEHPGVVPIYGVGTDADQQPYYAMRFIHGTTMKDAADKLHQSKSSSSAEWNLEFRRLLRSFVSVCQTMAYAHARGVIHRDLKPANVMLGQYGETLVVDWGLAKPVNVEQQEQNNEIGHDPICIQTDRSVNTVGAGDSVDGEFKGSPAYMAPEQARGEWAKVGPASDIYSLGATLYVLLTGKKPFDGNSMAMVFDDIKNGRFIPIRQANPIVPRPLEAICAKAMAARPKDRYATAQDLADDVERWLADEPVHAWREPLPVRARRWMKRHRTVVSTAFAAMLSVTVLLAAAGFVLGGKNRDLRRLNHELAQKRNELQQANVQLTESDAASRLEFEQADLALRGLIENLTTRGPSGTAVHSNAVQLSVFDRYRDYLRKFIDRNREKLERQQDIATTYLKLGEIETLLGDIQRALSHYERAQTIFGTLLTNAPNDRELNFGIACALGDRGVLLVDSGRFSEGKKLVEEARQRFEELAADPSPIRVARFTSDSTGDVYRDSPALRLAKLTVVMVTDLRYASDLEQTGRTNPNLLTRVPNSRSAHQLTPEQTRLAGIAIRAITEGCELPVDAPVFTQYFALQLELLAGAANPATERRSRLSAIIERVKALLLLYPAFQELRLLSVEAGVQLSELADGKPTSKSAESLLLDTLYELNQLQEAVKSHDPFAVRGAALVTRAEIWERLADLAARNNRTTMSHSYLDVGLKVIDEYLQLKRHSPTDTTRLLLLCIRVALSSSLTPSTRSRAETAYDQARTLCELQLRETQGDEAFEYFLLTTSVATGMMRAAQGKPIGDVIDRAEQMYKKLIAAAPQDVFLEVQRATMIAARATEANEVKKDRHGAIAQFEEALKVLVAAEKLPTGADDVAFPRLGVELQLAAALGGLAEQMLKDKPQGDPEALKLVDRSRQIIRAQETRKYPKADPELEPMLNYLKELRCRFGPELDKLELRAKGKK